MDEKDLAKTLGLASLAAFAKTAAALDPRETITPEMVARFAALDATTVDPLERQPRRTLPFEGLSATRLPVIDVQLRTAVPANAGTTQHAAARTGAHESDLVIRKLIAEGGMGAIYLAEQRSLAREVAIKTVKDPNDQAQLDALLWEGAIAGHLDHPGVTPVHLVGKSSDGHTILVMKRIDGLRWSDLIDGGEEVWKRFPMLSKDRLRAHLEILMEIARTIHFAHQRGVLHLDIKPDNVMIGDLGEVYVVDWGIATTTTKALLPREGFFGTPMFAAPEMVKAEPVGPWSDVYLLGATLHYVLTKEPRHAGDTLMQVLTSAALSQPKEYGSEIPNELADLANAATNPEKSNRPPDALAFRAAIATHLEHTASLELTKDGVLRLASLRRTDAKDRPRLATEARFAFKVALDRWPENPEAKNGLRECLELTMALEIDRENLAGALEIERELGADLPSHLRDRREQLAKMLEDRTKSAEELQKIRAGSDLAVGARDRTILLGAATIAALVAVGIVSSSTTSGSFHIDRPSALAPLVVMLALECVALLIFKKRLLANDIAKKLIVIFFLVIVTMLLQRSAQIWTPLNPEATEVRAEMFSIASVGIGLAAFLSHRSWAIVIVAFIGVACITIWPNAPITVLNLMVVGIIISIAYAVRQRRLEQRQSRSASGS